MPMRELTNNIITLGDAHERTYQQHDHPWWCPWENLPTTWSPLVMPTRTYQQHDHHWWCPWDNLPTAVTLGDTHERTYKQHSHPGWCPWENLPTTWSPLVMPMRELTNNSHPGWCPREDLPTTWSSLVTLSKLTSQQHDHPWRCAWQNLPTTRSPLVMPMAFMAAANWATASRSSLCVFFTTSAWPSPDKKSTHQTCGKTLNLKGLLSPRDLGHLWVCLDWWFSGTYNNNVYHQHKHQFNLKKKTKM